MRLASGPFLAAKTCISGQTLIFWNLYLATGSREAWAGGLGKKVTGLF